MMEHKWINRLTRLLPYVMLLVAAGGFGSTLLLHRADLSIFSLVLVVPLILAATFLLANKGIDARHVAPFAGGIRFSHLLLTNILTLILSVVTLTAQATRPPAYFVLVSLSAGVVLMQIMSERPKWTDNVIVLQIMLLSLNLIWGETLKYPLYFGDTDLLVHLNLIDNIVTNGHVAAYNRDYQYYALYHVFTALGVEITGGSIRTVLFLLMGLAWQLSIVFAFLIYKALSKSGRFACLAALLFGLSSQVVFYGSYAIARSLALVFFVCWLYLILTKARKDSRFVVLSVIVLAAMIVTHHINVFYGIPILAVAYVCQRLVLRSDQYLLELTFIYVLTIGSISYFLWIASGMADSGLPETIRALLAADAGLKSATSLTHGFGIEVVIGTMYYSFALFLGLLGISVVLKRLGGSRVNQHAVAFALGGFAMLAVYVPGFLYLFPLSDALLTDRLTLLASPFVAFLMALGMEHLYGFRRDQAPTSPARTYTALLPAGLVILATFFSAISIGNAKDSNYFPHTATVDSPYFTMSELRPFSFLATSADTDLRLYADYATVRNDYSLAVFAERSIIRNMADVSGGYLLLRLAELERKQSLGLLPELTGREYPVRRPIAKLKPEIDAMADSFAADRIYSDGDVEIYFVR